MADLTITPAMNRRHFLHGLFAAPAIVHVGNIMPVKTVLPRPQDLRLADIDAAQDYICYIFNKEPSVTLGWQPSFIMIKRERGVGKGWHYFKDGIEMPAEKIVDLSGVQDGQQIAYRRNWPPLIVGS